MWLQIDDFKGISYALIQPGPGVTKIVGKNGQGKTSATDALLWLLCGPKAGISKPVRVGSDRAKVVGQLGEYKVTRTKGSDGKDLLKVENSLGGKMPKPQAFIDEMLGAIGFDPGSFSKAAPKEQKRMILEWFKPTITEEQFLKMTGIQLPLRIGNLDLQDIDNCLAKHEEDRAGVGRTKRDIQGSINEIDVAVGCYPTERRSAAEIEEKRRANDEQARSYRTAMQMEEEANNRLSDLVDKVRSLEIELDKAIAQRNSANRTHRDAEKKLKETPKPVEIDFTEELAEIEAHNEKVDQRKRLDDLRSRLMDLETDYASRTETIEAIRRCSLSMVRGIDLGVDGLDLSDAVPKVNGVPLADLNDATKVMVGMRVAMAQGPEIKVIRIKDGNHLDHATLEQLSGWVEEEGWQVLIERVTEGPEDGAIHMVEGRVEGQSKLEVDDE